jgi:hypothetical protein
MNLNPFIEMCADNPKLWIIWFIASEYPELKHYQGPNAEL